MEYDEVLESPAYLDLHCHARCLLTEFQRIYRPGRNGYLSISVANAAKRLRIHRDTATKVFYELVEHGFLILRQGELWQERKAREWILTMYPYESREPTDDWRNWEKDSPVRIVHRKRKKTRSQTKGQTVLNKGTRLSQTKAQKTILRGIKGIAHVALAENQ